MSRIVFSRDDLAESEISLNKGGKYKNPFYELYIAILE